MTPILQTGLRIRGHAFVDAPQQNSPHIRCNSELEAAVAEDIRGGH